MSLMSDLTLEEMRRDVAIILRIDVAEVSPDENLIDLGLDSMRAMSLHDRWNSAGSELDFAALSEAPTLRRWWELVQAANRK